MRRLRSDTGVTPLHSMSSANESKASPPSERKRMAASERRRSRPPAAKPGRYHATTAMPRAWAASRMRDSRSARTRSARCLKFAVSRKIVRTPRAWMRATVLSGAAS